MIASILPSVLRIPFRQAFKHASAERSETQTLWVEARGAGGLIGYGEACPREYVTDESLESALAFVAAHEAPWCSAITSLDSLKSWERAHRVQINAAPAAWSAVEMALLDLLAREQGCSVEKLLGLSEISGSFRYSAVLGDGLPAVFEAQLVAYLKAGFRQFKIKLSGDALRDAAKVAALKTAGVVPSQVRADANNLFKSAQQAVACLEALDYGFFALEEPLAAGDYAGMATIARSLDCRVILDESLVRREQLELLTDAPRRWIGNLRISKMGGMLRSLDLVADARRLGISLIVGAHVGETSLLTRAALTVAQAAQDLLLAQEGAFGTHLLTRDVVDPPLMFGAGGVLDVSGYGLSGKAGSGLAVHR